MPEIIDITQRSLKDRLDLTIPEAMKLLRVSRKTIEERLETGRYRWFHEGARRRIITASILEDMEQRAKQAMQGAA